MPCTINLREAFLLKRQNVIKYFGVFYWAKKYLRNMPKYFAELKK